VLAQTWVGPPEDEAVEQGGTGAKEASIVVVVAVLRTYGVALYEVDYYWESEVRRAVRRSAKGRLGIPFAMIRSGPSETETGDQRPDERYAPMSWRYRRLPSGQRPESD
jgi:hypothetical protein